MELRVECHSGHLGEEEPRAFYLGERRVDVIQVLDRWPDPERRYFKVQDGEGNVYILRHNEKSGGWELTLFSAGPH